MEFGKLTQIDAVDFSLPPEPARNPVFSAALGDPLRIFIGATGYNMKEWVGRWYPDTCKERDFLRQYGKQFNTIEHNTTHYRIPDPATVRRWAEETPSDFRFCPKVPQIFSHARDLGLSSTDLRIFFDRMYDLRPRMGCCFLQLPPHFAPQNLPALERFLDRWPAHTPLAVEVRHPQFFESGGLGEAWFDVLSARDMVAVITDVAGRRDVCHGVLTAPTAMIRFVGNGLHASDYQRIDAWAERLSMWVEKGVRTIYFFTHEPDNLLAPELAAYTVETFKKSMPDAEIRGPSPWVGSGKQGNLFE